jgi:outer membrane lipoprotein-sorting protein
MNTAVATRPSFLRSPWAVPTAATAAVAIAILSQPLFASAGSSDLPELTAEEIVARALDAEPMALSGTVVHTARLGLPDMSMTEAMGADPLALLGGSSTLRVWTDGEERSRVSLLGTMSEWSVVTDGPEAWTYSSSDDEVVHYTLSDADRARLDSMGEDARAEALTRQAELPTPQEAAAEVLDRVEEHSTVAVDSQTTVAGRDAYQLIVTPDTDGTLVDRVVIALDGETMTPLRVQTWSTQDAGAPAAEVSFTDVDFGTPSDSVLAFSAPAGAAQRDVVVPLPSDEELASGEKPEKPEMPAVTGTGWETVVEFSGMDLVTLMAGDPAALAGSPERLVGSERAQELLGEFIPEDADGMEFDMLVLFEQLTTEVPEGRLLSSALLSVLVTDDGRILVGAVPAETLRAMA